MVPSGGWRRTCRSPTGSGPEGSSPNEFRHGSRASLPPHPPKSFDGIGGSPPDIGSDRWQRWTAPITTPAAAGPYRVLARKYRPQSFADLIGQEPMVRTLTNAFRTGRIAQAYMLTGVRGVGKTTTARILARALNYSVPGKVDRPTIDMDELGEHCAAIMEGRHVDVIEMDAASHTGIDDIREIIEAVRYKPAIARYKVYIIDEVHMLSKAGLQRPAEDAGRAARACEVHLRHHRGPQGPGHRPLALPALRPPPHRGRPPRRPDARHHGEGRRRRSTTTALTMIARAAEGSARDALSLLDQAIAHAAGKVAAEEVRQMLGLADRALVIDLFEEVMRGDVAGALKRLKELYDVGADPAVVLEDLAAFTHLVTRLKLAPSAADDEALTEEEKTRGKEFAGKLSLRVLARAWQMLLKGIEEAKEASRPLAAADMVLVRLAHAADLPTPDEALKALAENGAAPAAPARRGVRRRPATAAPRMAMAAAARARRRAAAGAPHRPPQPRAVAAAPRLESFADLVALAGEKRELKLKHALETTVRPSASSRARSRSRSPTTPRPGLAGELSRKLEQWTGRAG